MNIELKYLQESDFVTIVRWINCYDKDFMVQWAGLTYTFPLSVDQMQSHYHKGINTSASDVFIYKITETTSNETIGSLQFCRFDSINNEAVFGRFIIGDSNIRGSGIGTIALRKAVEIGFTQFDLKKIRLNVYDINRAAIRCYERVGFRKVKITENVYTSSQGITWNNWEMFLDKETWEKTIL
ncbi:GNAT family N-acetyltransferase [Paenibacillus puerhi]|uniref:GNAT family N-acetyltransferase n=1 Tax=Paenibacillus puerhi TaxID=2692622 RepID=UPI00135A382E|nr:GNAT family protein [Paenibacillus puerhi]